MDAQFGLGYLLRRFWQRRWGRSLPMLLGALFAVTVLVAVLLANGIIVGMHSAWARRVAGSAQLQVTPIGEPGLQQAWLPVIRARSGVAEAGAVVEQRSHLFLAQRTVSVTVRGVEPTVDERLRSRELVVGRLLSANDHDVTVLSESAAEELGVNLGSVVELLTPEGLLVLTVVGVYRQSGAGVTVRERVALMTVGSAQDAFLKGSRRLTRIDVAVAGEGSSVDPRAVAAVRADLSSLLAEAGRVRSASMAAAEQILASRGLRMLLLLAAGLTVIATAGLITTNGLSLLTERSADAATLQALGVSRRRLRAWLAAEAATLLVAVGLPGVLLGYLAAQALLSRLPATLLAPFGVALGGPHAASRWWIVGLVLVTAAGLLLVLLTSLLLRRLLTTLERRLLSAGKTPLWLRLSASAVGRRRLNASVSAATVLLTVAGLIGIEGALDSSRRSLTLWLDSSVTWDLLLGSGASGGTTRATLSRATLVDVQAHTAVREAAPQRQVTLASRGRSLPVIALEPRLASTQQRLEVVQALDPGQSSGAGSALSSGSSVALSVPLARRLNVGVGDQLPFTTQNGERAYIVTALVADSATAVEAAYLDLSEYAAVWQDFAIDAITLRLHPGSDAGEVAAALAQGSHHAGIDPRLFPETASADAHRTELLASLTETYRLVRAFALLAVLIALGALINAAVVASWQGQNEDATLRALGAPRHLVVTVQAAESAASAVLGVVAGSVVGTVLSWRIVGLMTGPVAPTRSLPVDAYTLALLLVGGAALTALLLASSGVWPARRSSP